MNNLVQKVIIGGFTALMGAQAVAGVTAILGPGTDDGFSFSYLHKATAGNDGQQLNSTADIIAPLHGGAITPTGGVVKDGATAGPAGFFTIRGLNFTAGDGAEYTFDFTGDQDALDDILASTSINEFLGVGSLTAENGTAATNLGVAVDDIVDFFFEATRYGNNGNGIQQPNSTGFGTVISLWGQTNTAGSEATTDATLPLTRAAVAAFHATPSASEFGKVLDLATGSNSGQIGIDLRMEYVVTPDITVPAPGGLALVGLILVGLGAGIRRRAAKAA